MKEATGELNSTIVVVIAVGVLAAFFYMVIWPGIKGNVDANTNCSSAWCDKCTDSNGCNVVNCHYRDRGGNERDITCIWKG